ncbi:MAG TPA: PIG-L family deacetylase [Steroidobacteraceae bacterium]|nr:PIG-L family deacetylase [Steroidobacteraceae bacterium]
MALLAVLLSAAARVPADSSYPPSDLARIGSADRLLVIAPHPDDESLCCGGMIYQARAAGAQVAIVWLTSGDAFELDADWVERTWHAGAAGLRELGLRRMQEARAASVILGVPAQSQFFLGFPDRGLLPLILDRFYVRYTSPYTGWSTVGYPGTLDPGSPYEGQNLQRQLQKLLDRLQPTFVLAPSPLDAHPDHRAAGILVIRMLGERKQLAKVRYWIVHGGMYWPWPRGLHPDEPLSPPRGSLDMQWGSVPLTTEARDHKLAALAAHRTQEAFGLEPRFLKAFVRRNELFAREPLPRMLPAPSVSHSGAALSSH